MPIWVFVIDDQESSWGANSKHTMETMEMLGTYKTYKSLFHSFLAAQFFSLFARVGDNF
jgi:hypothetical protein